jgi:formyltetrahydrofolate deformylase
MAENETEEAPIRLVIACPDQPGIVAAVSQFLFTAGANIIRSDQYSTARGGGTFFLRQEFTLQADRRDGFAEHFGLQIAERFGMTWRLWDSANPKRIAILVSREDHCMLELLWRWRRDELHADVVQVISNWDDLRTDVEGFGLPYFHVPMDKQSKPEAEARMLELLRDNCDVVVLARYMQILSGEFLEQLGLPVINIHHSFLPAFEGAGPYQRAKQRGVKLIGATAHYVTAELDGGPIIEQDVVRVTHADSIDELVRLGAEVERIVFARAVRWHCEDRVIRHGNSTVVF